MAYDPTVWKSGDTITSAKLNKLENGLAEASGGGTGGGVLYVSFQDPTAENPILNKTWQEIYDAATGGSVVIFRGTFETGPETQYAVEPLMALFNGDYDGTIIYGVNFTNYGPYNCGSPNGYPESNYTP